MYVVSYKIPITRIMGRVPIFRSRFRYTMMKDDDVDHLSTAQEHDRREGEGMEVVRADDSCTAKIWKSKWWRRDRYLLSLSQLLIPSHDVHSILCLPQNAFSGDRY